MLYLSPKQSWLIFNEIFRIGHLDPFGAGLSIKGLFCQCFCVFSFVFLFSFFFWGGGGGGERGGFCGCGGGTLNNYGKGSLLHHIF